MGRSACIGCLPPFLLSLFPLRLDEHLKFFRSMYGSVGFSTEFTSSAVHFKGVNVTQRIDGTHRCKFTGLEKQRFASRLFLCTDLLGLTQPPNVRLPQGQCTCRHSFLTIDKRLIYQILLWVLLKHLPPVCQGCLVLNFLCERRTECSSLLRQ